MSAPEKIWVSSDCPPTDDDWAYCSTEDDFDEVGVKYIRADIHEALQEEVKRLRDALLGITYTDRGGVYVALREDVDLSEIHPLLKQIHD